MEEQTSLEQVIYLEPNDDIAAIREALAWSRAERVILVLPRSFRTLKSKVNLNLLHRIGLSQGKDLALVTGDRVTRELSYEVGLPIFYTVNRARDARWNGKSEAKQLPRYRRRLSRPRGQKTAAAIRSDHPFVVNQLVASLLFIGILGLVGLSGLLVVPGATVSLNLALAPIERSIEIRSDPAVTEVDYENRIIPARLLGIEVEAATQMPTSAKRDSPDSRAKGQVMFVNQLAQPVTVPVGSVVATSAGTPIRVSTLEEVTLPPKGGGTVPCSVVAMDPGPSGNVKAFLINTVEGPLGASVKVVNDQSMSGGGVRQVGVVTQADKDQARTILLQQLQQKAVAQLQTELGEQEFIPPESIKVFPLDETYDRFVGEEADALGLKMRVAARGTVIGGHHANAVVLDQLEKSIDAKHQLLPDGLTFQPGGVVSVGEDGTVVFAMRAVGNIGSRVNKGEIISAIQGRPTEEATAYLAGALGLTRPPDIRVVPDWLGRIPFFPFRINIVLKTEAA